MLSKMLEVARSPVFWSAYFLENDGTTAFAFLETTWRFEVDDAHALALDVGRNFSRISLRVEGEGGGELGWEDLAHWHPHALRWEEMDAIGRAVAWRDPRLTHPGLVTVLLCRFAPMAEGGDGDLGARLLEDALREVGVGEKTEEMVWGITDMRHAGFRWRTDDHGRFVLEQDPALEAASGQTLYSLRCAGPNAAFPFARLEDTVQAARRTCAAFAGERRSTAVENLSLARVQVPFAKLGGASVHSMIVALAGAFDRAGAGRIVRCVTEYGEEGAVTGVSLGLELAGRRGLALAAAARALEAVGAEGATIGSPSDDADT